MDKIIALNEEINAAEEVIRKLESDKDRLRAENEALRMDAERYRWLRNKHDDGDGQWFVYGAHHELDASIDAARKQER